MNEIINTKSIGLGIEEVEEDIVLSEEPKSRLVFHVQIHAKGVRGRLIRQRRESSSDIWVPEKAIDIRTLGKNEYINLELNTQSTKRIYETIQKCINILEQKGIQWGNHSYAVVDPNSVIITDENKTAYIKKILTAGYGEDIWNDLNESNPSLVTKLSYSKIIMDRRKVLEEFSANLNIEKLESYWQTFFNNNLWIFGYGLKYQILKEITDQPIYKGADFDASGEQRGDYIMHSSAEKKFTVLVEIKKPQTKLVSEELYRSGTAKLSSELVWATSQIQINCNSWFRNGSQQDHAKDTLEKTNIYTYQPKGILVIGKTSQLNNREKFNTFEAYRNSINNPQIITFDELYERAKYIIETSSL